MTALQLADRIIRRGLNGYLAQDAAELVVSETPRHLAMEKLEREWPRETARNALNVAERELAAE